MNTVLTFTSLSLIFTFNAQKKTTLPKWLQRRIYIWQKIVKLTWFQRMQGCRFTGIASMHTVTNGKTAVQHPHRNDMTRTTSENCTRNERLPLEYVKIHVHYNPNSDFFGYRYPPYAVPVSVGDFPTRRIPTRRMPICWG